jgi:(p)ppGpp synthase/HD superfamily hydrolase
MTHPTIDETIAFAATLHAGQRDKSGVPYLAHPLAVMRRVSPPAWHVAVLHDVLEDCGVTAEDLRQRGYDEAEVHALEALTRNEAEEYDAFVTRVIVAGALAIEVKLADLDDNLDTKRLPRPLTEKDEQRLAKYRAARRRLESARTL